VHVVLEGNGHAREGPEPLASARRVGRGGGERKVGGDLEEGLHGDVALSMASSEARDLRRGEVPAGTAAIWDAARGRGLPLIASLGA